MKTGVMLHNTERRARSRAFILNVKEFLKKVSDTLRSVSDTLGHCKDMVHSFGETSCFCDFFKPVPQARPGSLGLASARWCGSSCDAMSISYNSSREEVLEAVRQNGNLLQNAHADLRKDRQIVVPTGRRAASSDTLCQRCYCQFDSAPWLRYRLE